MKLLNYLITVYISRFKFKTKCTIFSHQESVPELYEKLQLDNQNIWKDFVGTTNSSIPNLVKVSNFQQVLITQALKPDRLHKVLTEFSLNQLSTFRFDFSIL